MLSTAAFFTALENLELVLDFLDPNNLRALTLLRQLEEAVFVVCAPSALHGRGTAVGIFMRAVGCTVAPRAQVTATMLGRYILPFHLIARSGYVKGAKVTLAHT